VIASHLPMVEKTFPPGTVWTYEPGDARGLATAIEAIVDDALAREASVERTAAIVAGTAWEREAVGYLALVESLAADGAAT
jgi:hypothetical protein